MHLIPQENGALGILIDKGKPPSYSTLSGNKSALKSYNQIDVIKIGSMIAEELASGAPEIDKISSRSDNDGYKMSVNILDNSIIQNLDFPKPESVET